MTIELNLNGLQIHDLTEVLKMIQSKSRSQKKERIQLVIDQLQKNYESAYTQAVTEYFRN
jgi:hypothetical protein